MIRTFRVVALGFLVVLLPLMAGCQPKGRARSELSTKIADREVKALFEGPGFISTENGSAIVTFPAGKLRIEATKVLLDGKLVARVPADVKVVVVDFNGETLAITADGNNVLSMPLEKP